MIIGLDRQGEARPERRLFFYSDISKNPEESLYTELSPYLFDAGRLLNSELVVSEVSRPINGMSTLTIGSQPIDNKHYIFSSQERAEFISKEPYAEKFMRPYLGAREHIQGNKRWILALQNATPNDLKRMPKVIQRMRAVRSFRSKSKRKSTLAIANYPSRYNLETIPTEPFLVIPRVSSERRDYMPIGWVEPPAIPSDAVIVLEGAVKSDFALLTSAMHMAWLRYVGGRLESRYRYSISLVYNTFPVPPKKNKLSKLELLAQAVLDARAEYPESTLAELYDPDLMPSNLRRAHKELDREVDRLYKRGGFSSDRERIEHLFSLYEKMVEPLKATPKKKPKRRRSVIIRRK